MKQRVLLGVVLVVFLFIASLLPEAQKDDNTAVKKAFQKYVEDWNQGDLDGVFSFVADDFVQMPPSQEAFIGKKAIMEDWKTYMAEFTSKWEPELTDIVVSGDLAYLRGPFVESRTPKSGGETTTQKGDGIWVLRRNAQGEWRLILELWFGRGWE
jgi:uncharacterized protein (TIGR02246 family)